MWNMLKQIAILLICLVSTAQATEEMVIIHSNTAAFTKGQLLVNDDSLAVLDKAEITVVFPSGGVLTVMGPQQGRLTDPLRDQNLPDTQLVTELAEFIRTTEPVERGNSSNTDIWSVDISSNKRYYCVATTESVTLSRNSSDSNTASTLLIKHKPSEQQKQMVWPAHQTTMAWPNDLALVSGDTYTIEMGTLRGQSAFKKLIVYQLPGSLPTNSHKVVWMVSRGCIPQANRLLASLR